MSKIVFTYRGKDSKGTAVNGSVEASDKDDALAKLHLLEAQGFCDLTIESAQTIDAPQQSQNPTIIVMQNAPTKSKHGLPALLSFFIPGLGQLVKGQVFKSIAIFIGAVISLLLCMALIGLPIFLVLWLWNIVDAYNA